MSHRHHRTRVKLLASLAAFTLVAAACGSDDDDSGSGDTTAATEAAEEPADEPADSGGAKVVILSTQANPVEEAEAFRDNVLSGFSGESEFIPAESPVFLERIQAEAASGEGDVGVTIALHGDYPTLAEAGAMMDLSDIDISSCLLYTSPSPRD